MKLVINKWKLNKSLLSSKMDMTLTTFCNKLKDDKFTDKETIRLKMVLKELYVDLEPLIELDFNNVLKTMVQ